jgi:hypothetical protein
MESMTSVERISSIIVLVLAVLIVRENRRGAKVVKSDPNIQTAEQPALHYPRLNRSAQPIGHQTGVPDAPR